MAGPTVGIMRLDRVRTAIVTATSQVTALPAANLQHDSITRLWRSLDSPGTIQLNSDFGVSRVFEVVGLLNTNLSASATFRLRISENVSMSSPTLDTGTIAVGGSLDVNIRQFIYILTTAVSGRYMRLEITDATKVNIEAGKWLAGTMQRPVNGHALEWRWIFRDLSTRDQAISGEVFVNLRPILRGVQFSLHALTDVEARGFAYDLARVSGVSAPLLVLMTLTNTTAGRDSLWGLLEDTPSVDFLTPVIRQQQYTIFERR